MNGHFTFSNKREPPLWNRHTSINIRNYPIAALASACLAITLASCHDNNNDNSNNADTPRQITVEVLLRVEDAITKEMLGGVEVLPRFYMEGQAENLKVSLYDARGHLVAGYAKPESFQAGDVRVPGPGLLALNLVINEASDAILAHLSASNGARAELNLAISRDGYFSNATSLDILSDSNLTERNIRLLPNRHGGDFAATFAEGTVATNGNVVAGAFSLSTALKSADSSGGAMLDGARVRIDIPSGTELLDESGQPLEPKGDLSAKLALISGDPKGLSTASSSPLLAFPVGLEIADLRGDTPDDLTNTHEFSFISAGLVAFEIADGAGNRVHQFRNGTASIALEVPKSTINPNTSLPISLSDGSIPFWSYSTTTARWSYEGTALITTENPNTFTLVTQITHLTYFNLDWYQSNRCKWTMSVVDASGQPNNRRLGLSFIRKGGGWAYRPYGSGGGLDRFDVARIPAFEGTFDILSNDNKSLLRSITVDGTKTSASASGGGIGLNNFCFGLGTDATKTFTAELNVGNPPLIDLPLQINLACPTDSNKTSTTDAGSYYLYEGGSYIGSGAVSGGRVTLGRLIENGTYRFYYQNSTMSSVSEFTANTSLAALNILTLSACPTVSQILKARLVCLDSSQSTRKQKPATSTRYWVYSQDYFQYLTGTTSTDGKGALPGAVGGIKYLVYAYAPHGGRFLWRGPVAFTAAADQEIGIDIALPNSDVFCTTDLPIDYTQTTMSASAPSAPADGVTRIRISAQERDEYGNRRQSNTGALTLTSAPSGGVTIDNVRSLADGTYAADIYASSATGVAISGAIDGHTLGHSVSVDFTVVAPSASQSTFTLSQASATAGTNVTVSITLKKPDGSNYGQSGGALTLSSTPAGVTFTSVTDNGDGTYSATASSASVASYSLTASVGGVVLTTTPSVTFSTPPPSASQSTFTVSSASTTAGTNVTVSITLKKPDGSNYGQSGGALTLSSTPAGVTFASVTDNGDGTYSATASSASVASYSLTATVGGVTLTTTPSITFSTPPPSASQSTFTLSSASTTAGTNVTVSITLKKSDGSNYGQSGGALTFSSTPAGVTFASVTDNGDGTYSATASSASVASYSLTATVGGVTLTTTPSVTFSTPPPSASQSTFTVSSASTTAGTNVTVNITLRKSDGSSYGQSGGALTFSSTPAGVTFASVTDNGDGTYSATASSASVASYSLTATVGGVVLTTTPSVTFSTPPPSASQSTFTLSSASTTAGTNVTVSITLKKSDGSNYGQSGGALTFSSTPAGVTFASVADNGDGTYSATASSASVATYSLTASVGGVVLTTTPSVTFSTPPPSASQSIFTVSSASTTAGTNVTVSIILRKADGSSYGQSGGTLTLSSTPAGVTFASATDNGDGTYSATASSASVATYSLTASVGGVVLTTTPSVTFSTPPPSASQSIFTVSSASTTAGTNVTVSIILRKADGSSYGQSGGTLTLSSTPAGVTFASVTDNGDGTYSATASSASVASYSLTATVGGVTLTTTPSVTFSTPPPSGSQSAFTVNRARASTGTNVTINVTLKKPDGSNYGQSGGTLALSSMPSGVTFGSVTDNADGTYTATAGSATAASYALTATIGGITLTTTPAVSFTQVDTTTTTISPASLVVSVAGGPGLVTATLRQSDGSLVGHGGHLVTVSSVYIDTLGVIPKPTIGDNLDGTYTITATCTVPIGGLPDTVSVRVDSVVVGSFALKCDP